MAPEKIPHLSKKDREKILQRDGYTSGLRGYSEERGFYDTGENGCPYDQKPCDSLQVHHIDPVRWWMSLFTKPHDVNDPDFLMTVFECQHVGRCKSNRIREEHGKR